MARDFEDLVKVNTDTVGTGNLNLTTARTGFLDASILTSGQPYSYSIRDGSSRETGRGTLTTTAGPVYTLTRNLKRSTTGSKLSLSGTAIVSIGPVSDDYASGFTAPKEDVASASTTDLGATTSRTVRITGTTTITSFGTVREGVYREGYFSGALTLTHNATSLILPGGGNITTAANDRFGALSLGSGNWIVLWYTRAANLPLYRDVSANLTVGYTATPNSLGNMTNFTVNPALGNYQYGTNNAAFTLTAPASDCAVDILVTNHATTAGTITFSGFTAPSGGGGDVYATTGNNKYLLMIRRINSVSTYLWKALQ